MMRRTATLSLSAALALGGAACGNDEDGVDDVEDDVDEEIDAQDEGDNQDDDNG